MALGSFGGIGQCSFGDSVSFFDLYCGSDGRSLLEYISLAATANFVAGRLANCNYVPHSCAALPLLSVRLAQQRNIPAVDAQAGTPAAPWPHYLIAFGLMLLLATTFWWKQRSLRPKFTILWAWIFAAALLLYSPLNPQRRFIQGVHLPLAILAAAGFVQVVLPRWQSSQTWQKLSPCPGMKLPSCAALFFCSFCCS